MAMTATRMKNLHDFFVPTCATAAINPIQFNRLTTHIDFWILSSFFCSSLLSLCYFVCLFVLHCVSVCVWSGTLNSPDGLEVIIAQSTKCANNKSYDTTIFTQFLLYSNKSVAWQTLINWEPPTVRTVEILKFRLTHKNRLITISEALKFQLIFSPFSNFALCGNLVNCDWTWMQMNVTQTNKWNEL